MLIPRRQLFRDAAQIHFVSPSELRGVSLLNATMALVATAFPGSIEEESTPLEAFDTIENEQDRAMMDVSEDAIQHENGA